MDAITEVGSDPELNMDAITKAESSPGLDMDTITKVGSSQGLQGYIFWLARKIPPSL